MSPDLEVRILDADSPVEAGETLTVDVAVTNGANVAATQSVTLEADGSVQDSTEVTVEPGQEKVVTLEWHTESGDAGEYTVAALSDDDTATANATVTDSETTDETQAEGADTTETGTPGTEDSAGEDGPGFDAVAVLVAVGALLVGGRLRR